MVQSATCGFQWSWIVWGEITCCQAIAMCARCPWEMIEKCPFPRGKVDWEDIPHELWKNSKGFWIAFFWWKISLDPSLILNFPETKSSSCLTSNLLFTGFHPFLSSRRTSPYTGTSVWSGYIPSLQLVAPKSTYISNGVFTCVYRISWVFFWISACQACQFFAPTAKNWSLTSGCKLARMEGWVRTEMAWSNEVDAIVSSWDFHRLVERHIGPMDRHQCLIQIDDEIGENLKCGSRFVWLGLKHWHLYTVNLSLKWWHQAFTCLIMFDLSTLLVFCWLGIT